MVTNNSPKQDVLEEVAATVLNLNASEFLVEYDEGTERVFAVNGLLAVGVAAIKSTTKKAEELRRELYGLRRKRRKIMFAGIEYALRVNIFDSFGEDAFRVVMKRTG